VNVVVLGDHVPEIDTDPKVDPLVARDGSVPFGHTTLDCDRARNGFDDARELDQHAIASRLHDPTFVFSYLRIDEFAAMGSEPCKSAGLVPSHEAAISGDISGENGRQPALDPFSAHLAKPRKVNPRVKVSRNANWRDG
jgi:hypothetical protein